MRMTSAPRCASCSVANGPAQTQVKSATRIPASGLALIGYASCSRSHLGENLGRMLTEERCRPAEPPGGAREDIRRARNPQRSGTWVLKRHEEATGLEMLRSPEVSHRRDRGDRHAA